MEDFQNIYESKLTQLLSSAKNQTVNFTVFDDQIQNKVFTNTQNLNSDTQTQNR